MAALTETIDDALKAVTPNIDTQKQRPAAHIWRQPVPRRQRLAKSTPLLRAFAEG